MNEKYVHRTWGALLASQCDRQCIWPGYTDRHRVKLYDPYGEGIKWKTLIEDLKQANIPVVISIGFI